MACDDEDLWKALRAVMFPTPPVKPVAEDADHPCLELLCTFRQNWYLAQRLLLDEKTWGRKPVKLPVGVQHAWFHLILRKLGEEKAKALGLSTDWLWSASPPRHQQGDRFPGDDDFPTDEAKNRKPKVAVNVDSLRGMVMLLLLKYRDEVLQHLLRTVFLGRAGLANDDGCPDASDPAGIRNRPGLRLAPKQLAELQKQQGGWKVPKLKDKYGIPYGPMVRQLALSRYGTKERTKEELQSFLLEIVTKENRTLEIKEGEAECFIQVVAPGSTTLTSDIDLTLAVPANPHWEARVVEEFINAFRTLPCAVARVEQWPPLRAGGTTHQVDDWPEAVRVNNETRFKQALRLESGYVFDLNMYTAGFMSDAVENPKIPFFDKWGDFRNPESAGSAVSEDFGKKYQELRAHQAGLALVSLYHTLLEEKPRTKPLKARLVGAPATVVNPLTVSPAATSPHLGLLRNVAPGAPGGLQELWPRIFKAAEDERTHTRRAVEDDRNECQKYLTAPSVELCAEADEALEFYVKNQLYIKELKAADQSLFGFYRGSWRTTGIGTAAGAEVAFAVGKQVPQGLSSFNAINRWTTFGGRVAKPGQAPQSQKPKNELDEKLEELALGQLRSMVTWGTSQGRALIYANEAFFSGGPAIHVVAVMQSGRQEDLSRWQILESALMCMGYRAEHQESHYHRIMEIYERVGALDQPSAPSLSDLGSDLIDPFATPPPVVAVKITPVVWADGSPPPEKATVPDVTNASKLARRAEAAARLAASKYGSRVGDLLYVRMKEKLVLPENGYSWMRSSGDVLASNLKAFIVRERLIEKKIKKDESMSYNQRLEGLLKQEQVSSVEFAFDKSWREKDQERRQGPMEKARERASFETGVPFDRHAITLALADMVAPLVRGLYDAETVSPIADPPAPATDPFAPAPGSKAAFFTAAAKANLEILGFTPCTTLGRFDARYDRIKKELHVTVKVYFVWTTVPNGQPWDEADKQPWVARFKEVIEDTWSDCYTLAADKDGWRDLYARVYVHVQEVGSGSQHYTVDVVNLPKGDTSGAGIVRATLTGRFGRWDVEPEQKLKRDQGALSFVARQIDEAIVKAMCEYLAFGANSSDVPPEAAAALVTLGTKLRGAITREVAESEAKIYVYGKIGSEESRIKNLTTGKDRANAVAAILRGQIGFDAAVKVVESFEKEPWMKGTLDRILGSAGLSTADIADRAFPGVVILTRDFGQDGEKSQGIARSYVVVAHEFGHMIGLPDEYFGVNCQALATQIELKGCVPAAFKRLAQLRSSPMQQNVGPNEGFANLLDLANVPAPTFMNSMAPVTTSIMYAGMDVLPAHYLTFWEALLTICAPYLSPTDWKIVPNGPGGKKSNLDFFKA